MAQFVKHYVQDLMDDIKIRQGGTIVFNGDNLSNAISVDVLNNGEPATISGTVVGAVICSDGSTVPVDNGSISGNTVSITLTAACFDIPGLIGVGIQLVTGTTKTTLLKAVYNVELLTTNNVIDPSSRIALEVSDLIDDINAAIASIPSDYTDLMAAVAPTFSTNSSYSIGQCVWYSGKLYRFTAAHSGPWSTSDVALANSATEIGKAVSYAYEQTLTATQQTRARTNIAAASVYSLYLGNSEGITVESGTDLNTLLTPGTYKVATAAVAATLTNGPTTTENYRFIVSYGPGSTQRFQIAYLRTSNRLYSRSCSVSSGVGTWGSWRLIATDEDLAALNAVSYSAQSLTDAQKEQARTNIGAAPTDVVSYGTAQTLTDTQQAQARENIAAPSAADVDDAIQEFGANLAAEFSDSTAYIAGQYVRYEGTLYRFTAFHAAGDWTGTDAEAVALGNDVSGLIPTQTLNGIRWTYGSYVGSNGSIVSTSAAAAYKMSDLIPCYGQGTITVVCDTQSSGVRAVAFYRQNHKYFDGVSNIGTRGTPCTVTVPAGAYFLRLTARIVQTSAYVDFNGTTPLRPVADELFLLRTEHDTHMAEYENLSPYTFTGGRSVTENTQSWFDGMSGDFKLFEYPSGFAGTYKPVNIWTDGEHFITDFRRENFLVPAGENSKTIYAAPGVTGDNDGGRTTPVSIDRAVTIANDGDTIILLSGVYNNTALSLLYNDDTRFKKHINIIGEGDVRLLNGGVVFAGAYDSTEGVWTQSRSGVTSVIDGSLKFAWEKAESLADCKGRPGTWYYASSTVYINSPKTPNVYLVQELYKGFKLTNLDSGRIYFENISFIGGAYNVYLEQASGTNFEAIFNRCNFLFSYGTDGSDRRNAVWAHSGHFLFYQCRAGLCNQDGFGYTPGSSSTECQFVELECIGFGCGSYNNPTGTNLNGSTCHSGTKGIRINGIYYGNAGGNVADVQDDTQTINLGCAGRNSIAADHGNAGMSQGISAQQSGATMWCYNCSASGNVYDFYCEDGATLYAYNCTFNRSNKPFTMSGGNHIPLDGDLNDYFAPGVYICEKRNADTLAVANIPTGLDDRFSMQVIESGRFPYQIIYDKNRIFIRRSGSVGGTTGWLSWYKIDGTVVT